MLARCLVLVVLVGACGYERVPVTKRVATLGYSKPPAIAIVSRGPHDLAEPWAASLRAATTAEVVTSIEEADTGGRSLEQLCKDVRGAVPDGKHVDEIVTIDVTFSNRDLDSCIKEECDAQLPELHAKDRSCTCVRSLYQGTRAVVSIMVTAHRASSCELLRTEYLPNAYGASTRAPFEYGGDGIDEADSIHVRDAKVVDFEESRAAVVAAIALAAPHQTWQTFPRGTPIVSVVNHTVVVGAPLPDGDYWLKIGSHTGLEPGIRAVDHTPTTTTFQLVPQLATPEAGDELHITTDMRRVSGYFALGGGTARAHGETYPLATAVAAARFAFDRMPVMSEIQISGDLIPGLGQSASVSGAAGFRLPFEPISPVAFAEVGIGPAHQGSDGARSFTGHVGLGAGFELWLQRWFIFGDIRRRWFALSDWVDSEGNVIHVEHDDSRWRTTSVQLGVGKRF